MVSRKRKRWASKAARTPAISDEGQLFRERGRRNPTSRKRREKWGFHNLPMQRCSYGETVIDAVLLMTLPIEAVTVTAPPLVKPATPETRPADTVARLVLLEVHVATLVTSTGALLLHGVAVAVSCTVKAVLLLTEPLVGFIVIEVTHWLTVTVCVPVIDGFALAVAVTVAVPRATDVTKPVEEIVATPVGVMVQATGTLLAVLPSLLVPNTVICTVLLVVPPIRMVGDAGPTTMDDRVGLTKKPVQPTSETTIASAQRALARQSLCLADDIVI